MRANFFALALCLLPPLAALSCHSNSDTAATPGTMPSSSTPAATGKVPFGQLCSDSKVCSVGQCYEIEDMYNAAGDTCTLSSCRGICTDKCETDDDCPDNGRCTNTPKGVLCLPRCEKNSDCTERLVCGRAGTEGVCWDYNLEGGDIKFRTELSIVALKLAEQYEAGAGDEFLSGAWRLVPGLPVMLNVGLRNTGSGRGSYQATIRAENEWIDVVYSGTNLMILPDKGYGAGVPASIWAEKVLLKPKAGIPVNEPLAMSLVLVKEGGLEETTVPFNLTSLPSSLDVTVSSISAAKLSAYTNNPADKGYLLSLIVEGKGFGGAVISEGHIVSGATEAPLPPELQKRFYDPQQKDRPFFGLMDGWETGHARTSVVYPLVVTDLPAGPITVELSERPENVWQATQPVMVVQ